VAQAAAAGVDERSGYEQLSDELYI
jgi:hypothetical protein